MKPYSKKYFLTSLILSVIAIFVIVFLQFLPMTNIIGYEFSAASAILMFLYFGILTIHRHRVNETHTFPTKLKFSLLLIVTFPLIVSVINTFVNSLCPVNENILFYFIITIPTAYFGFVAGKLCYSLNRKLAYLLFGIIFVLLVCIPVMEIYFYPQVYFYNPIIVFFPGTIYDEAISVSSKMLFYRSITLLLFVGIHQLLKLIKNRKAYLLFLIFPVIAFILVKPLLGFATTESSLKGYLKEKMLSDDFLICYSDSINDNLRTEIFLNHQFSFQKIEKILGFKPKRKVTSFVFSNRMQKGELFGAENADVAKPWSYQIFIEEQTSWSTIKHELAHVISAEIGTTPFKVAEYFNPAMIEGFAMAIENNYSGYDPHYLAFIAFNSEYKVSLKEIFTGLHFFENVSSISYIFSGSFIKWLMSEYGIENILKLYSDVDFKKYYHKGIEELEEDYYNFLNSLEFHISESTATLFFGRKPVFKKFCARETAKKLREADNLFRKNLANKSAALYEDIYRYSESFYALRGLIQSLAAQDKIYAADSLILRELDKFNSTSYFFNLELMAGDIKSRLSDSASALEFYSKVVEQNPSLEYCNSASLRLKLLSNSNEYLNKYLTGDSKSRYNLLKLLNSDSIYYESFPSFLYYIRKSESDVSEFIDDYYKRYNIHNLISAFAAQEFIEFLIYHGHYEKAVNLAMRSLEFTDNRFKEVWEENLEKSIWFSKFASDYLTEVQVIDHKK